MKTFAENWTTFNRVDGYKSVILSNKIYKSINEQ